MAGIFGKTLCIPSVWSKFNVPIGLTGKSIMGSIAASSAPAARLSSVPPDSAKKAQVFGRMINQVVGKMINLQPADNPADDKVISGDCRAGSPPPVSKSLRKRLIGNYEANPHLYNSLRKMWLKEDNSVYLVDGYGQHIHCRKLGQWKVTESSIPEKYTLHITNLKNAPGEHQSSKLDAKNITVDFKIVNAISTMIMEMPVRKRPTLTCFSKLVFDQDPLELVYGDGGSPPNLFDFSGKKNRETQNEFYEMSRAIIDDPHS